MRGVEKTAERALKDQVREEPGDEAEEEARRGRGHVWLLSVMGRRGSSPRSLASGVSTGHARPVAGGAGRVVEPGGAERFGEAARGQPRAGEPGQDGTGVDPAVRDHASVRALERRAVETVEHLLGQRRTALFAGETTEREHRHDLHSGPFDPEPEQELAEALIARAAPPDLGGP